jgi:hypothetical protein
MITDPILRAKQIKALKAYYRVGHKQFEAWIAGGFKYTYKPLESMPYPEICKGRKCEAKTRSGHTCKNYALNGQKVAVSITEGLALDP